MGAGNIDKVFYATSYHPIQSGSIDGTDVLPHDDAVRRALLCSKASLYDPFGDPKVIGDPYCTVFVGRLSHLTTEDTLRDAMSYYGRVKNLRLVRHIVTGASRGYAFVEYETEQEMRRAYEEAHHSIIDDSKIIVDYNRQQLMPGWIPRRLGGGLGGRKESGQLRFGGRERPFRAPLRPIPHEALKRLGIPPPPQGRYMSRFEVPSPPRRKRSPVDREERYQERSAMDRLEYNFRNSPVESKHGYRKKESRERRSSLERDESYYRNTSASGYKDGTESSGEEFRSGRRECSRRRSRDTGEEYSKRSSRGREKRSRRRTRYKDEDDNGDEEHSGKRRKHRYSPRHPRSPSQNSSSI